MGRIPGSQPTEKMDDGGSRPNFFRVSSEELARRQGEEMVLVVAEAAAQEDGSRDEVHGQLLPGRCIHSQKMQHFCFLAIFGNPVGRASKDVRDAC